MNRSQGSKTAILNSLQPLKLGPHRYHRIIHDSDGVLTVVARFPKAYSGPRVQEPPVALISMEEFTKTLVANIILSTLHNVNTHVEGKC